MTIKDEFARKWEVTKHQHLRRHIVRTCPYGYEAVAFPRTGPGHGLLWPVATSVV